MRSLLVCVFAVLLFTTGCAVSVPLAPMDARVAAQRFQPSPGRANLYVYRTQFLGAAFTMSVLLDGEPLGQTAPSTYLHTPIAPGRHSVVSKTAENESGVVIDAQPGRNYFLWQEAKFGALSVRSLLQSVDEQTGRDAVADCELAVTNPPSVGFPPRQVVPSTGCAKDTDCKGDRICRDSACVDPSPPPAPARPTPP
jgi:hypothetical protein